jgi:hypothetical protein
MGITAMIPNMTFKQLQDEANSRWGEIWDSGADRIRVLLLIPRTQRKLLELHGDMIEHGQPVMAIFHRPRVEAHLLEEVGFDPRLASFQFLDIASADLGPWMQQLVTQEGWLRSIVEIAPVPFVVDIPNQRTFERHNILCFRHADLPSLSNYHLPYPIDALVGKAFVSLPRRQAAELARQQAEILGVGLAKPEPVKAEVPVVTDTPEPVVPNPVPEMEVAFVTEMVPEPMGEASVPLPGAPQPEVEESVPLPSKAVEVVNDMPEIEIEFRGIVQTLLDEGVDPSEMMSDPRLEDVQERAMAIGFETWPVFMQMVT